MYKEQVKKAKVDSLSSSRDSIAGRYLENFRQIEVQEEESKNLGGSAINQT